MSAAFAVPAAYVPASAAPMKSCGPVKMAGYPQALAIKVKVKGLSCADATVLWTSYISSGEALAPPLDELKARCKDDSKAARKKAAKANRLAIVCRKGKVVTTAGRWAADAPPTMATMPTDRLVVCLGDSVTQGQFSANYVTRLQSPGTRFVNSGKNGQLAYNVGLRLSDVVARRPDVVTLLVGTNDVNAQFDESWRARYRRQQRLPVAPTRDWYGEQLDAILTRLRNETDARVAVLDLPPLGEDLSSRMNKLVDEYNTAVREVAAAHTVPVLPLHERLVSLVPPDAQPPPYLGDIWLVFRSMLRHAVLRRSWDSISRRNGLTLLTDHLHLNDRAADVVADLITESLERDN